MLISIGPTCHPAGNLRSLGLRNESLPFDWLLINSKKVFEYINDLINTNFNNFTTDLVYNHRNKVVSQYYKYVEFFHHDLIKNTVLNRPEDNGKNLVEMMNRRAVKFMNIITNNTNEVVFLCMLHHAIILDTKLYKDMIEFDNNNNIKCKYKILVYLYNDDDDYILKLPNEFSNLKHFIFDKYIRNRNKDTIYGSKTDFETMLKKHKLI